MGTTFSVVQYSLPIENRSQIISSKNRKNNKKKHKKSDITQYKTDSEDNANSRGYVFVVEEHTRAESHCRNKNGCALHSIQAVKLGTVGTAHHLEVESESEKKHGEHLLQVGAQWARKNDDRYQNRLPEHNDRFPEDVLLPVGSIEETACLVDPAILVLLLDVSDGEEGGRCRESKSEDDQKRPSQ